MSSLIANTEIGSFTGILANHFDTFKKDIVVFKEPKRELASINSPNSFAGYGDSSTPENVSFVPVSGIFSALVTYQNNQTADFVGDIGSIVERGIIKIKVETEARDYIKKGKTENVIVDSSSFNVISDDKLQNFLGLKYYIFFLEKTN